MLKSDVLGCYKPLVFLLNVLTYELTSQFVYWYA